MILILGVVLMITGTVSSDQDYDDQDYVYEPYEQDYESDSEVESWSTSTDQRTGIADQR